MMASAPILDYASPRKHGKTRLPTKSILSVERTSDGIAIVETLSGKLGAILAIIFALCILALYFTFAVMLLSRHAVAETPEQFALVVGVWIAEAATMLAVIHNTWRKTRLEGSRGKLILRQSAPFSTTRRFAWSGEEISELRVVTTSAGDSLAELQIISRGQSVARLFTDHGELELHALAESIRGAVESKLS